MEAGAQEMSPDRLRNLVYGFQQSRIVLTAYELGVFSGMKDEEIYAGELAARVGADPKALERLLNALTALELVEKKNGRFRNTAFSAKYLVEGSPDYMAGLMHGVNLWNTWSSLTEVVRTGKSIVEPHVGNRGIEWLRAFIAAMHWRGVRQAGETIDHIDLSGVKRILDVGGGSGAYAMEMVRRTPDAMAVLLDLPEVVGLTRKYVEDAGLSDRIRVLAGDYTRDELGEGYDLVYLCAIVHSNDFETNRQLIRKCANALVFGGRLVIVDYVMNDDRTMPPEGAIFSINMLVSTQDGDNPTESDVRSWCSDAGLELVSRNDLSFGTSVIIAQKCC